MLGDALFHPASRSDEHLLGAHQAAQSPAHSDHNMLGTRICTSKISTPALPASCTAEFATVTSQR